MALTKEDKRILETLAELGGARFQEDDIVHEGTQLILPERMTAQRAVDVLRAHIEQQEEWTGFSRDFMFRPWDGALATVRAIKTLTGTEGLSKAVESFFGSSPPQLMTVSTGVNETTQVPWGTIAVPLLEAEITLGSRNHEDWGPLFRIQVDARRKYKAQIDGLFLLIEQELQENSMYRGKAFDGQDMPDFIDLEAVKPEEVIYADDVEVQLTANMWSMLQYSDMMRLENVPLKRSVLLHGPYGTGKTLAAFLTARYAVENQWTFIYCRPGRDNLTNVMATARLYQPSVVFFEDVDNIASGENDGVTQLLDLFDGITAKGTEILVVLTTNHPERIHKGMVRPGRLDAVIEIGALDETGIERMIHAFCGEVVDPDLDYEAVANAMHGFLPAFVKEAVDRAKRYAIARTNGMMQVLVTEDFVSAAKGLRPQLDMMESAGEGIKPDHLSLALQRSVVEAVDGLSIVSPTNPSDIYSKIVGVNHS